MIRAALCLVLLSACSMYDVPPADDTFAACCAGAGRCVPQGLLPSALAAQLPAAECTAGLLCVPNAALEPPRFAACDGPGLCVPECFIAAEIVPLLGAGSCGPSARCVPCSQLPLPDAGCP